MTVEALAPAHLARLRALAEKAHEGHPWKARHSSDESEVILDDGIKFGRCVVAVVAGTLSRDQPSNARALADFMAAFDPPQALALLDQLAARDARLAEVESERDRETELRRAAERHNAELREALGVKPYLDEYQQVEAALTTMTQERAGFVRHIRHFVGETFGEPPSPEHEASWLTHAINHLGGIRQDYVAVATELTAARARIEALEAALRDLDGVVMRMWQDIKDWTSLGISAERETARDLTVVAATHQQERVVTTHGGGTFPSADARFISAAREAVPALLAQLAARDAELRRIDAVMARRPALDKPTRWENIAHAIETAGRETDRANRLERELAARDARIAELTEEVVRGGNNATR